MQTITIAKGDGIGPEIMDATLSILKAAGARLEYDEIMIGEAVYLDGHTSGIGQEAWDAIRRNKVFLKAPVKTPLGGGYKSLNVTLRKALGLYANVRPCRSYHPYIRTRHPEMDVVVIRENEEDLYAGIEHQQTEEVVQCLKLITRPGSEKIIRYAFEYAKANGRKKITCFTKNNIMKQTDGLFHRVFEEIAPDYPEIETEHMIIDIAAARLADTPERFDVVVLPNLYGDVVSDIAAQISGSVGLAGSSNLGQNSAMFEAIHGSAPDIEGQDIANPSGLINAAIMMLNHIGQSDIAVRIENAWLKTIEDGIHTADIYKEGTSTRKVGTREFAEQVIERLGEEPRHFTANSSPDHKPIKIPDYQRRAAKSKKLKGVDIFVDWKGQDPEELAGILKRINGPCVNLQMITNRGVKVWPEGLSETFCTDHWRCRYITENGEEVSRKAIVRLLGAAELINIDVIKTENLYEFDGERGFSLGQGQ